MMKAIIAGTGSYLPKNIVSNDDLSKLVETSDEWISTRTGIKERRITNQETTTDLAYKASVRALESSNIKAEEIDLIICATMTPDNFMPSVACVVQEMLGAIHSAAFDLSAACTGMIYAMSIAEQFIKSKTYKNILIIGSETLSRILNWEDRGTCVLFGDGAGAMVLTASEKSNGILASTLYADGSKNSILTCPAIPLDNPYNRQSKNRESKIKMEGQEVFKFAIRSVTKCIKDVLQKADLSPDEIKYIIPHQANKRIIEQSAKYSNIPEEKFFMNLQHCGNTSAASVGIALDELAKANKLNTGDYIILVGFGGGMTSGAILLKW